jgi:hypothetical protein
MKAKKAKAKPKTAKIKRVKSKTASKTAKAKLAKEAALSAAASEIIGWRFDLQLDAIMHRVDELVKATAMNGGLTPDNESKLVDIENAVRDALGEPRVQ